jgi:hypothetical protein
MERLPRWHLPTWDEHMAILAEAIAMLSPSPTMLGAG